MNIKVLSFLRTSLMISSLALTFGIASAEYVQAADASKGKESYDKICVQCHGAKGLGDGPIGLALPEASRPASLATGEFKFAKSDEKMIELIKKGGAAVGLNPLMPAQASLDDEAIKNIIAYVRSLKK